MYNLIEAKDRLPVVTKRLDEVADKVKRELIAPIKNAGTKRELFQAYGDGARSLAEYERGLIELEKNTLFCNTTWEREGVVAELTGRWVYDPVLDKAVPELKWRSVTGKSKQRFMDRDELVGMVGVDELPRRRLPARAEVALLPLGEAREQLSVNLAEENKSLWETVSTRFDLLIGGMQVGLIEFLAPDVAEYCGWETRMVDGIVSEDRQTERTENAQQVRTTTKVKREVRRRILKKLTVKDVIEVETKNANDMHFELYFHEGRPVIHWKDVGGRKMPDRVIRVLSRTPEWLLDKLEIVMGDEIREETAEAEIGSTMLFEEEENVRVWEKQRRPQVIRSRFRPDPALKLGPYVLMHW